MGGQKIFRYFRDFLSVLPPYRDFLSVLHTLDNQNNQKSVSKNLGLIGHFYHIEFTLGHSGME